MPEEYEESRWPTRNTKLASALLVLGFQIKNPDPFSIAADASNPKEGYIATIWFTPSFRGMFARTLAMAWESRDTRVPWLGWMRYALERRDWLLKIVRPAERERESFKASLPSEFYKTGDLRLASVLSGCDRHCLGFSDREFYYTLDHQVKEIVAHYAMSDEELATKGLAKLKDNWQKKVVAQQDILISRMHEAARALKLRNERGDVAFISDKSSNDNTRRTLHELAILGSRITP